MKHSTASKKKQPPTEARTVRFWPTSMREEIDQPIGFAPTCPVGAQYPTAGRKVAS